MSLEPHMTIKELLEHHQEAINVFVERLNISQIQWFTHDISGYA